MKRLVLLASFAILTFAQAPVGHDEVSIAADSQVVDGAVSHLSGHIEIETNGMLLKADRAYFDEDTLKITARGYAQLKQHRQDPQTGPGPQQR